MSADLSVAEAITEAGKPPIIPKDHEVLATYGFFVGTIDGAVIVSVSYN